MNNPLDRRMFNQQMMNRQPMPNQPSMGRQPMGILASSPQLMNATQGYAQGGQVVTAKYGKYNSVSDMGDSQNELYDPSNLSFMDKLIQGQGFLKAREAENQKNKAKTNIDDGINSISLDKVIADNNGARPIPASLNGVANGASGIDGAAVTSSDAQTNLDIGKQVVDFETTPNNLVGIDDINSKDLINDKLKESLDKKKKSEEKTTEKTTTEGSLANAEARLAAINNTINNPESKEATAVVSTYKTILDEAQAEMNKVGKELTLEEVDKLARPLAGVEDNASYDDDKHTAFWMALIKGGLATAAGESSNALTNIAKGLSIGVDAYGKDINKISAEEREDRKALGVARYKIITDKKSADVALRSAKVQFLQTKAQLIQGGEQYKEGMQFKKDEAANSRAFQAANLEIAIFKTMNDTKLAGETLDLQKKRLANDKDYREKLLDNAIKTLESNERMKLLGDDAQKLLALGDDFATYKDGKYKVKPEGRDLLEIFLLSNNSHKLTDTMEAIKNATVSLEVGGFRYKNAADAKKAAFLWYKTTSPAIAKASGGPFGNDAVKELEDKFYTRSGAIERIGGSTVNSNNKPEGDGFGTLSTN